MVFKNNFFKGINNIFKYLTPKTIKIGLVVLAILAIYSFKNYIFIGLIILVLLFASTLFSSEKKDTNNKKLIPDVVSNLITNILNGISQKFGKNNSATKEIDESKEKKKVPKKKKPSKKKKVDTKDAGKKEEETDESESDDEDIKKEATGESESDDEDIKKEATDESESDEDIKEEFTSYKNQNVQRTKKLNMYRNLRDPEPFTLYNVYPKYY